MSEIEKQIEEMAKDVKEILGNHFNKTNLYYWITRDLYDLGYRNCKDKVVLSRKEYQNDFSSQFNKGYEKGSKETAKEIIEMLVPPCEICDKNWYKGCLCFRATIAEKIAEKYGVEVE